MANRTMFWFYSYCVVFFIYMYIKKEFARKFQISSKKINNINKIFFDLEKNIDNGEISISNVYFNEIDTEKFSEEYYIVKNFQVLKGLLRKLFL